MTYMNLVTRPITINQAYRLKKEFNTHAKVVEFLFPSSHEAGIMIAKLKDKFFLERLIEKSRKKVILLSEVTHLLNRSLYSKHEWDKILEFLKVKPQDSN